MQGIVGDAPDGASLLVRVIPRAGVTKLDGIRDGRLLVRLAAAPVDGAANDALRTFLSRTLRIPARSITVAASRQGRNKRVVLSGISVTELNGRLSNLLTAVSEWRRPPSGSSR